MLWNQIPIEIFNFALFTFKIGHSNSDENDGYNKKRWILNYRLLGGTPKKVTYVKNGFGNFGV